MDSTHCLHASVYVTGVSSLTVLWLFFFSFALFRFVFFFTLNALSVTGFRYVAVSFQIFGGFFSLWQQILSNPIQRKCGKNTMIFFCFHHYFYFAICCYTGFIFLSRLFNINNSISNHDMFKFSWFWYEILQNIWFFFQATNFLCMCFHTNWYTHCG